MNHNADADEASTDNERMTLFQKVVDADEGDNLTLLGERLKVGHKRHSAASVSLDVWGRHEEHTQKPRYTLVADARHDSVEILPTERTDTHEEGR